MPDSPQTPFCSASPADAPACVREYLRRCGGAEDLVVCWTRPQAADPHEQVWVIGQRRQDGRFNVTSFPLVVHHWSHQLYCGEVDLAGLRRELASGLWQAPAEARRRVAEFLDRLDPGADGPARLGVPPV